MCRSTGAKGLVYCSERGARNFTNCAFLLGAYLVIKYRLSPGDTLRFFEAIDPMLFEGYRDASHTRPDFTLDLADCWGGLARAVSLGWIAMPAPDALSLWGMVDEAEYAHFDSPLNGNLHAIVPRKLLAFRGPRDLGGETYRDVYDGDGHFCIRDFSPEHCAGVLHELGACAVVRLNSACYDRQAFLDRGIAHHDLYFPDCTPPPPPVVAAFLAVVDGAAGAVAVHCMAGLGRTGSLIGAYMVRTHGFSALEAMGWLRVVRPGSVIGDQQRFLCAYEAAIRSTAARDDLLPLHRAVSFSARPGGGVRLLVASRRRWSLAQTVTGGRAELDVGVDRVAWPLRPTPDADARGGSLFQASIGRMNAAR